jgi:hypothetical protein
MPMIPAGVSRQVNRVNVDTMSRAMAERGVVDVRAVGAGT